MCCRLLVPAYEPRTFSHLNRKPLHGSLAGSLAANRQRRLGLIGCCRLDGAASARSLFKLLQGGLLGVVSSLFEARSPCNQALQVTMGQSVVRAAGVVRHSALGRVVPSAHCT